MAGAGIAPTADAAALAAALAHGGTAVASASFETVPPAGEPNAVSDTPLGGFPVDGPSYAILSTGEATFASNPNDTPDTTANDEGGNVRGSSDADVTILRVGLRVPQGANCVSFDFKFLTEEYPEYVGGQYNDAFLAELDTSDWSESGAAINAPHNFAFDPSGRPISVNAAGATTVTPAAAAGTTYDGATPTLRAATQVTPGDHTLYLSIFDLGDPTLDSAVFVDNLVVGSSSGGSCAPGATVAPPPTGGGASTTPSGTAAGSVLVSGKPFSGGTIPYGVPVDVTHGKLDLSVDAGRLSLYGQGGVPARFQLGRKGKVVELRLLRGGGACGRALAGHAAKRKPVTRLWASGKGRFRTKTQYVSATVKGTIWETEDLCDGSRVFVRRGVVSVVDLVKHRTLALRAGRSYVARAPRR